MLQEFSEWAQCQVLEFASHYRPSGEQEVYDFMNVLDDRLSHSNSAVVMATVKLFLHYTLTMPATHQQVSRALIHVTVNKVTFQLILTLQNMDACFWLSACTSAALFWKS